MVCRRGTYRVISFLYNTTRYRKYQKHVTSYLTYLTCLRISHAKRKTTITAAFINFVRIMIVPTSGLLTVAAIVAATALTTATAVATTTITSAVAATTATTTATTAAVRTTRTGYTAVPPFVRIPVKRVAARRIRRRWALTGPAYASTRYAPPP